MRTDFRRALLSATAAGCAIAAATGAGPASAAGASCHGEPATYVGTSGDDRLDASDARFGRNPVIVLGGGNDLLDLGSSDRRMGKLVICGGRGDDEVAVFESTGADAYLIDGGPGSDYIGNADDPDFSEEVSPMTILGGSGDDHLRGGNQRDRLVGGPGDDRAFGLGHDDRLVGGSGDDALFGLGSDDTLLGGGGDDILDGDSPFYRGGEDTADGGADSDRCMAELKVDCER